MKKLLLPLFALAALALPARAQGTLPRPDPAVAEFARGVKFTVAGYDAARPALTNFPVLVRLSDDSPSGFHYTDMMYPATGSDLCFVGMDGAPLAFEIDTNAWNAAGTSHIWVTLPVMSNNTEFVMCYRCTTDGSGALVSDANAWTNFVGVWHMGEPGNGEVYVYDSSPNKLHGKASSKSLTQSSPLGGARQISSAYDKKFYSILVDLSKDSTKLNAVNALGPEFTVSFWMKNRRTSQGWMYLISRKADDNTAAWGLQTGDGANEIRVFSKNGNDGVGRKSTTVTGLYDGNWHKVDAVYKSTAKFDFYWDGVKTSDNAAIPSVAQQGTTFNLAIGGHTSGTSARAFQGDMDEVRLRCGAVDDNWVAATYSNECSAAFLASGAVESFGESATPVAAFALDDSGAAYAKFSGSVSSVGGGAGSATAYIKLWKTAGGEPSEWTTLATGLVDLDPVTRTFTGLDTRTSYSYKFKITNNLGADSTVVSGNFETAEIGVPGTGGSVVFYNEDVIHTFRVEEDETSFEFTPPSYVSSIQALVVGGGGPGGYARGGGGGAGGYIYNAALGVTGGATYSINVGTGGVASASSGAYGSNGGDSSLVGDGVNLVAHGGGAGGNGASGYAAGVAGGSGGGSAFNTNGGAGTSGQGNAGGKGTDSSAAYAGGGGGAGAAGSAGSKNQNQATWNGGGGGAGLSCDISGVTTYYAGGGGGGGTLRFSSNTYSTPAGGGDGGGGRGGQESNVPEHKIAVAGTDGLGGGGGGGSGVANFEQGGNGGSGIVIVRYSMVGDGHGIYEPIVSMTSAIYNDADSTADVGFNVVWAGDGFDTVNVSAIYGYSEDHLVYTNANIATGVIGKGTGTVSLPRVSKKVYVRLIATNAGNHTGVSADVKSFMLFNPAAPVARVSASQTLGSGNKGVSKANLEADVTTLGAGAASVNGVFQICSDEFFDEGTYATFAATNGPLAAAGTLKGGATGLLANTVYWVRAVLTNDVLTAGEPTVYETEPVSFLTDAPGWPWGRIQPSNDDPAFTVTATSISATFSFNGIGEGAATGSAWLEVSTTHDVKEGDNYTERFDTGLVASSAHANVVAADIPALLSFTVEGLEPETDYYVRYRVRNDGGRETSNDRAFPFRTPAEVSTTTISVW